MHLSAVCSEYFRRATDAPGNAPLRAAARVRLDSAPLSRGARADARRNLLNHGSFPRFAVVSLGRAGAAVGSQHRLRPYCLGVQQRRGHLRGCSRAVQVFVGARLGRDGLALWDLPTRISARVRRQFLESPRRHGVLLPSRVRVDPSDGGDVLSRQRSELDPSAPPEVHGPLRGRPGARRRFALQVLSGLG